VREHGRAAWALTSLAFRASPLATSLGFLMFFAFGVGAAIDGWWVAHLIDRLVAGDRDAALMAAVGLTATNALLIGVSLFNLDMRFRIEESTGLLVDQEIIAAMASTPTLELHERPSHLDKIEVLRAQRAQISQSVSAILEWLAALGTGGTSFVLLARLSPLLLLVPVSGAIAVWASARMQVMDQRLADSTAERRRRAAHLLRIGTEPGPAKELRTFGVAPEIVRMHDELYGSTCEEYESVTFTWGLRVGLGWMLFGICEVLGVGFMAWRAVDGHASIGDVMLVLFLNQQVNQVLQQGVGLIAWLFGSLRAAGRYVQVLDLAASTGRLEPWEAAPAPSALTRGIELVDVGFAYGDGREPVLHDVNLTLPAGSIVALVGENGAGKTTLVKLLARFYEPSSGAIRVDGVDLSRMRAADWRSRLSGAFQDHKRFELVAREVVGIGDLDHLDDEPRIVDALGRAGGADLPERLDRGLDTTLGRSFNDGIEPSGGQWQQLALGRALLRDRPILLLLDEPTSALDPDAEHALFEGYAAAAKVAAEETGAITLLVSHRFSTVRMADLIVVLENGTVAQTGTHDDLMATGGTYAELYTLQARAYQ
jgi:ABC-type multidrug transport system fused ATPase/permease subunit